MYPNTLALNNGVRIPQLGAISLPKTANPSHMETLKHVEHIESYGQSSGFPVYGGRI